MLLLVLLELPVCCGCTPARELDIELIFPSLHSDGVAYMCEAAAVDWRN